MNLNIDREWLLRMAEKEAGGCTSVGGLMCRVLQNEREAMTPDPKPATDPLRFDYLSYTPEPAKPPFTFDAPNSGRRDDGPRPPSFAAYQAAAHDTAIYPGAATTGGDWKEPLLYLIPGLCAETGELAGKIAKNHRDKGCQFVHGDVAAIRDELGDILWFVAEIAGQFGLSLGGVAARNLEKLASRAQRGVIGGSGDDR